MSAGTEGTARINIQHASAVLIVILLPRGTNRQLFPDFYGMKIFFPFVCPILLVYAVHAHCKAAGVKLFFVESQLLQRAFDHYERISALSVIGKVNLHLYCFVTV